MFLASFAEIISIGSVLPFLGMLTNPEQVYQHSMMQPINQLLSVNSAEQLLLPFTLLFIMAVIMAAIVRLSLLYIMIRLSYATGADLSINIYQRTLYQEYAIHMSRNSSEVINGIINKTSAIIGGVIRPILTLMSSSILIIAVIMALIAVDPVIALSAFTGFGALYFGVARYTRQHLQENSQCIADQSTQMIKSLQEGMGGIRDVLIDGSQQFYCKLYRDADLPLRKASGDNAFIAQSPRYIMESIGMTLIAGVAYFMSSREAGMETAIPVLGALALGAQRLLPALQQAYAAYSNIKGADSSFNDVLDLLDQPLPGYANQKQPNPIPFSKEIVLQDIKFKYNRDSPWILKNINIKIEKGSRIGFIGVTGSGKSTLLDIVMGLLSPTEGVFTIDKSSINTENRRAWQAHIAHVPQNIYLSDSTIEENIAFGIPKEQINHKQVEKAAKQAQIVKLIDSWEDGYQTFIGERGVRLSGGQRQRIGIARALYKNADVLIFDEATSALDNETEKAVMEAIEGLDRDLTILIIAHRLSTLNGCDRIIDMDRDFND